jgi:hypothetical protein
VRLVSIKHAGVTVRAERRPTQGPAGHRFEPYKMVVSFTSRRCAHPGVGHRTWTCLQRVDGGECGLTTFELPHRE